MQCLKGGNAIMNGSIVNKHAPSVAKHIYYCFFLSFTSFFAVALPEFCFRRS